LRKLRISIVQYLNTAPLVWGFTNGPLRGKYDLSFTVPSQCAEALRNGAADVAIIPAIEYQRIDGLAIFPDLAIASKRRVRSLLLLSKGPIEEARRIALDRSSRSTQALTKILCVERWKLLERIHAHRSGQLPLAGAESRRDSLRQQPACVVPEFFETAPDLGAMRQDADAVLLIGDPALRLSLAIEPGAKRGPAGESVCSGALAGLPDATELHVYDIVEQWRKMTDLPAVLALWAARNEIATAQLVEDFLASREYGLQHISEICADSSRQMQLPERELRVYLEENIDYSLDEENLNGLITYYRHADALGLVEGLKPIVIAPHAGAPVRNLEFNHAPQSSYSCSRNTVNAVK
jgi:chorismate dehydratase